MAVAYEVLVVEPFGFSTSIPLARYFDFSYILLYDETWNVRTVSVLIQTPGKLHHLIG